MASSTTLQQQQSQSQATISQVQPYRTQQQIEHEAFRKQYVTNIKNDFFFFLDIFFFLF
jgi:hypothetical protein